MPRFYFHLIAGDDRVDDQTGLELRSAADAIEQGRRALSELQVEDPALSQGFTGIEIRDDMGKVVLKAPVGKPSAA